jgi:hypothetical protein
VPLSISLYSVGVLVPFLCFFFVCVDLRVASVFVPRVCGGRRCWNKCFVVSLAYLVAEMLHPAFVDAAARIVCGVVLFAVSTFQLLLWNWSLVLIGEVFLGAL